MVNGCKERVGTERVGKMSGNGYGRKKRDGKINGNGYGLKETEATYRKERDVQPFFDCSTYVKNTFVLGKRAVPNGELTA